MERQYIGARYVPKFSNPVEWNKALSYEAMTIVTYLGNSFTSKKPVPAGVDIANGEYWVNTGNYNAQIEAYRADVTELKTQVDDYKAEVTELETAVNDIPIFGKSVKDFGAVGDGVTDDTAAFQSAIYDYQQNGVPIFIPNGEYRITATLAIDTSPNKSRRIAIYGQSAYKTVIRSETTTLFNFSMPDNTTIMQSYIKNLTLISGNGSGTCLLFHRAQRWVISDVIFRNFNIDIDADYSWTFRISNCNFDENVTNYHYHIKLGEQTNAWLFDNCSFSLPTTIDNERPNCLICNGGASLKFLRCQFAGGRGIQLNIQSGTRLNIDVDTCYFEWINGYAVYSEVDGSGTLRGVRVCNNYINNIENAKEQNALGLNSANGVVVVGNAATRYTGALIYIRLAPMGDDVIISGNSIEESTMLINGMTAYAYKSGNAAPTSGKHQIGEVVYNKAPSAGTPIGWICIADGTPGTWAAMANL